MELHAFQSVNGSLEFLGITVSPFASLAASQLQQTDGAPSVKDLVSQVNVLRSVQKMGTVSLFARPAQNGSYKPTVLIFSDAARPSTNAQIGYLIGLLLGPLELGSNFYLLSWSSHMSKRPAKSSASAEILAASEAVDDGRVIRKCLSRVFNMYVSLVMVVDSKDSLSSLSTSRVPQEKSIAADVTLLRYYFETKQLDKLVWIPGKINIADALTKRDSPLCNALQLLMFDGALPHAFTGNETADAHKSRG